MLTRLHVGSDISSQWIDVCFLNKKEVSFRRYDNNSKGHAEFIKEARERAKKIFLSMEHTGGYEKAFARACHEAGFIVSIVDGAQIAYYRRSFGAAKAKTDVTDAQLLANYCRERTPARWLPLPDEYLQLKELVKLRQELLEDKTRVKAQIAQPVSCEYSRVVRQTLLDVILAQIEALKQKIQALMDASPHLTKQTQLLKSIPGIAFASAIRILAETGPISNYSTARDYALAAGLVPIPRQSGTKTPPGKLPIYGNQNLRNAFYFPAVVNSRCKTNTIGLFMERIRNNGPKATMTVITAGMRKIAHIVFGVLKNQTEYNPDLI